MGLQDRDYMRRRHAVPVSRHAARVVGRTHWRTWLFAAGAIIAVATAAVWLLRDVRYLVSDSGPTEGSLIVNINTAAQAQLETLPEIGPSRAAQIIAGRPYQSIEQLKKITGIGTARLETLRPFVTTEGATRKR